MGLNDDEDPRICINFITTQNNPPAPIKKQVAAPQPDPLSGLEFTANVRFVDDPSFANLSCHDIVRSLPADYSGYLAFVFDNQSKESDEHSLLVVDFSPKGDDPRDFERNPNQVPLEDIRTFRAIPSSIQSIENNLSIANMDFDDFRMAVRKDGIFEGFAS